jgi:hypothetical protein
MLRKLIAAGLVALAVASCGSGSATPSPSASTAPGSSSTAGASDAPTVAPSDAVPTETALPAGTMTAACDSVALRKKASTSGAVVARVKVGTTVHVAATVNGTAYTPGGCGVNGKSWLKIDQVDGKTVKSLYGSTYVYAAAGLFN